MLQSFKKFLWVGLLIAVLPSALAYSLLGPVGNGGDAWQVKDIGYGYDSDIGAPKNWGEGYRLNVPTIYYSCDAAFLGYFGLAGSTNVDATFAILNGLTNVSSYSSDLSEFPLSSEQINYSAQSLGLVDLKSYMLGLLIEHSGLASPDRYVYTLHNRFQPAGATCPNGTFYSVVQRNFDVAASPLSQVQYSAYVNGTLYTYQIIETCQTTKSPEATTIPYLVDPLSQAYTPVASFVGGAVYVNGSLVYFPGLDTGGFYTGLTRDDVAGLRYLLSSNNLATEATSTYGSLLLVTNTLPATNLLTTLPISLLFAQSVTNDPGSLQAAYPGITFLSVTTNIVNQIATNVTAYFTNLSAPYTNYPLPIVNGATVYPSNGIVPFTNWSPVQYGTYPNFPTLLTTRSLRELLTISPLVDPPTLKSIFPDLQLGPVTTNYFSVILTTNVFPYYTNLSVPPVFSYSGTGGLPNAATLTDIYLGTNQPGPTVINYDNTYWLNIPTLDLANFADAVAVDSPDVLLAAYPSLEILATNSFPGYVWVTNYVTYLTNQIGYPVGTPPILVTAPVSTNYVFTTNWTYVFGNVFTNHYYTNRYVSLQTVWTTNKIGAPYPNVFTTTNTVTYRTNRVSGDFLLIPTNWCGFDLILSYPKQTLYGVTNFSNYGAVTNVTSTNITAYGATSSYYDIYTNYAYAVRPGICEPVLTWGTNYSTNIATTYQYTFLNVVTNHYYTNSLVTVLTTNVYALTNGSPNLLGTNVTQVSYYTNLPDGDFYTVPPTWCGYQILPLLTNFVTPNLSGLLTNTLSGPNNLQYVQIGYLTYTNYTYSIRPGFCEPALAFATNYGTNITTHYGYYFGNVVTNSYYTNSPVTVVTTNLAILTNGLVGQLTNTVTTNVINGGVSGDFFVPPAAWCSYTILATQLTSVVYNTSVFAATNAPGVQDLGQSYEQVSTSSYTNSTFLVQVSTCGTATPAKALRQGVERIQYVRASYDSTLGQFFTPITNTYTMVKVVNSQPVTEYYQRVVSTPDIVFSAADLNAGPASDNGDRFATRTSNIFDESSVLSGLAGPGVINPSTKITLNKAGPTYYNTSPYFLDGPASQTAILWASFDGTTNLPVVYPSGTSIADLEAEALFQAFPTTLPVATHGTAYSQAFTVTGGQPPYVLTAPGVTNTVPGMSFSGVTLSGTPAAAGTFSFTLQVTDSLNRVVILPYTLTVQ
jgi:hypothetical protein